MPFIPTYATLKPMLGVNWRSIVRFQSCAYMSLKLRLIAAGPRLVVASEAEGFSTVMTPELTEMGTAKGGFPLRPTTMFVVGSWVRMA